MEGPEEESRSIISGEDSFFRFPIPPPPPAIFGKVILKLFSCIWGGEAGRFALLGVCQEEPGEAREGGTRELPPEPIGWMLNPAGTELRAPVLDWTWRTWGGGWTWGTGLLRAGNWTDWNKFIFRIYIYKQIKCSPKYHWIPKKILVSIWFVAFKMFDDNLFTPSGGGYPPKRIIKSANQ